MPDPNTVDRTGRRHETIVVGVVVAVAVVARFVTRSPLWLDEALSVNIASLPYGEIGEALRADGHPPLYYFLLHAWIDLFGSGDVAVRSMSAIFSIAALPLAFVAGRRRAGPRGALAVLLIVAITPWAVRYGSETRMYSLVFLLTLAAWLLADDLLRRPSRWRWIALATVTAAGLLTHYWVLYSGIAAVGCLAVRWVRDPAARSRVQSVVLALAAGVVGFLPWLSSFVFQALHTGTPWAGPSRPTQVIAELAAGIGGGVFAEAHLFGWFIFALVIIGAFGERSGSGLVLTTRPDEGLRAELSFVVAILGVATLAGYATSSTFVVRYAAAFLPPLLIAAGVGLARVAGTKLPAAFTAVLLVLGGVGWAHNVVDSRTQGEVLASRISSEGALGDVVAFCPDQLGPATVRALPEHFDTVRIPDFGDPSRIDWVDYADRNQEADPVEIAARLLDQSGGGGIWVVYSPSYVSYEGLCEGIVDQLRLARPGSGFVLAADPDTFEAMALFRVPPAG